MSIIIEFVVKLLETIITKARFGSTRDNIERIVALYDAMKELVTIGLVHRVLIVKVENGGGIISPGKQVYASAMHEDYNPSQMRDSIKADYQRILVDKGFVTILSKLMTDGYSDLFALKLPKGFIKSKYEAEGVKYAEWYLLHRTSKAIFFLSLVTTDEADTFDNPFQRNCINVQVNIIRNAISGKKYKTSR